MLWDELIASREFKKPGAFLCKEQKMLIEKPLEVQFT